ncbi:cell wall hydrolase [Luteimonas aestuarii]|uniref:N-acetylmuramoyl-L-alanine amidase n=1 Tax=Luteimonas aestuarii TaxID=453837 RepID=A0A4R5TMB8_9GAMM|nr:N-acetylmuramoyl-L-alanine amidase [Luteimonas aestuarii]TDK23042.1 cell wall hydrolase [Luteimonas aestuarii]
MRLRAVVARGVAVVLASVLLAACSHGVAPSPQPAPSPLVGRTICLDPGHGGTADTDHYRQGPTGEREEWINLRVAQQLQALLEQAGATVVMTRDADVFVPLADRARIAREAGAELFLSIHHNATADPQVNFPIVYFHGNASENRAGVALGQAIVSAFRDAGFPVPDAPASVVSDHTVFAGAGAAVLREGYGIPGVLAEASFFTHPDEEQRLKTVAHNRREAEAYFAALEAVFAQPLPPVLPKGSIAPPIPPFRGLQEAERMGAAARRWQSAHAEALALADSDPVRALALFTESARAFPDSPLAGDAHARRAELLARLGRTDEAAQESARAREHYPAATP